MNYIKIWKRLSLSTWTHLYSIQLRRPGVFISEKNFSKCSLWNWFNDAKVEDARWINLRRCCYECLKIQTDVQIKNNKQINFNLTADSFFAVNFSKFLKIIESLASIRVCDLSSNGATSSSLDSLILSGFGFKFDELSSCFEFLSLTQITTNYFGLLNSDKI